VAHARAEVSEVVHRSPRLFGHERSRWWLAGIRRGLEWLSGLSLPGVWKLLRRLKVHYKRGRQYVHSPDPDYDTKLAAIAAATAVVRQEPTAYVLLYEDELTYYRRPSLACAYGLAGHDDVRAQVGLLSNRKRRVAASLDIHTGRVLFQQRASFRRRHLLAYFRTLESAYPHAHTIFLVVDNWPVHFHPDVLDGLRHSKIRLLRLPTYAPWTNPVEKLWRLLAQHVLHLHAFADDWLALQATVHDWLAQFASGSRDLLHSCALPDPY
jgi:DDE superfamily endonuclease